MEVSKETEEKLNKLEKEYKKACFDTIKEEADKINSFKKGDIIEDHYQKGRYQICKIVECKVMINVDTKTYDICYVCQRLTEELKPKDEVLINVYLPNVRKISKI